MAVPDMTYNVFSGTFNPAQSINHNRYGPKIGGTVPLWGGEVVPI